MWKFLEPVLDSPRIVWVTCVIIYAINCVLVCMRSEMAIDIGFKKMESTFGEWAAHGQPTVLFWDC